MTCPAACCCRPLTAHTHRDSARNAQVAPCAARRELRDYGLALAAPTLLAQLTGMGGRIPPVHNLTISNVPRPQEPLYWNGARLSGVYPISLLPDGDALNITQLSYAGSLELGITAARDRLPQVQRLIDHLEESLIELEKAARA